MPFKDKGERSKQREQQVQRPWRKVPGWLSATEEGSLIGMEEVVEVEKRWWGFGLMWHLPSPGKDWLLLNDSSKGVSQWHLHFVRIALAALLRESRAKQGEGPSECAVLRWRRWQDWWERAWWGVVWLGICLTRECTSSPPFSLSLALLNWCLSSLLVSHPFVFLLYFLGNSENLLSSLHFYHHHILNLQELASNVPLCFGGSSLCLLTHSCDDCLSYLPKDICF